MRRRSRRAVLAAVGAATLAACFPDYAVGPGDGGGVGFDGPVQEAGGDSTVQDAAGDTTSRDAGGDVSADAEIDSAADARPESGGDSSTQLPDSGLTDDTITMDGGTFTFEIYDTTDAGTGDHTKQATLSYGIVIDRTEETVGRFQAWVAAGQLHPASMTQLDPKYPAMLWDSSWDTDVAATDYSNGTVCNTPGGKGPTYGLGDPSLPMNCINWAQALAFCWWDNGRRLPTDTEWRVVATSGAVETPYPWGSQAPDCTYAIFDDGSGLCGWPVDAGSTSAGKTQAGVYDIVGSLSEWLWDFLPAVYRYPASAGTDYPGPTGSGNNSRIWIGGDYSQDDTSLKVDQAGPLDSSPSEPFDNTGFRCARSQ